MVIMVCFNPVVCACSFPYRADLSAVVSPSTTRIVLFKSKTDRCEQKYVVKLVGGWQDGLVYSVASGPVPVPVQVVRSVQQCASSLIELWKKQRMEAQ